MHAQLLLTTNSARVRAFGDGAAAAECPEGSQLDINTSAYERYFDKPEVIRAYREQQLIQTPEFTLLSEHEAVGGRFRPRSLDDVRASPISHYIFYFFFPLFSRSLFRLLGSLSDAMTYYGKQEGIDTSDAAYEKRHRKYEAFEKRQRLREKEKLKHEHYKLKERIEQLRPLEPSAFLSAPDSFFASSRQRPPPHRGEPDTQQQGGSTDVPATSSQNEGEWRKRLMLDVANGLDARYRTLLDTAPSRAPDFSTPTPPPPQTSGSQRAHTPSHTPAAAVRPSPVPSNPPVRYHPRRDLPLPSPTEIIELDSDGEEKTFPDVVKVEPVSTHAPPILTHNDSTESLKLRIRFPNRRPPASTSPGTNQRAPSPRPRTATAAHAASSPKPLATPSPTRPRPKPIFKDPRAPPGPHARSPFAKRVAPQDAATVNVSSPLPSSISPHQSPAAPLASNSITLPTLHRRPGRTVATLKLGIPAAAAGVLNSRPQQPLAPADAHGSGRPRKRRRIELSDEEDGSPGLHTDDEADGAAVRGEAEEEEEEEEVGGPEAEEEEEEEDEDEADGDGDGDGRRRGDREPPRERWRSSALYREAQRHAGAPSGRKTHRHLGIFGLKGFPAEVEHLRNFVPPVWALPREDPRVAAALAGEWEPVREVGRRRGDGAARGAERVRGGAAGGGGGGGEEGDGGGGGTVGGGGGGGEGGDGVGIWQRRLRDALVVAGVAGDGEETSSCGRSDAMMLVETASAIDSQATELMIP